MPEIINNEEYLTAGEAARYLGVSGSTFSKWQDEYKLKAVSRPGQRQRKFFRKKDLEPLLEYRPIDEQNGHKEK